MDRDKKLTVAVSEEERRRYMTAAAWVGRTLSDVVREHLERWSGMVLDTLPAQMSEADIRVEESKD